MNSREAAFAALRNYARKGTPIAQTVTQDPLAYEIAAGTVRRKRTLDAFATALAEKKSLSLKGKERDLLRMALYQIYYLDRVPLYAIANEMVELAKKECHPRFVAFLHAMIQATEKKKIERPSDLATRYSYPDPLIDRLIAHFDEKEVEKWLEIGNVPPPLCCRRRGENPLQMEPIPEGRIKEIAASPQYYIQNQTPVLLMGEALAKISPPETILDLCASPGGKLLLAHDLFPSAKLTANDASANRIPRLQDNCKKYELDVDIHNMRGEEFPTDHRFDLILLDVPCTNTGVLHKRPEARWRFSEEHLGEMTALQWKLLAHATELLAPGGHIAYLTCSILPEENGHMIAKACRELGLQSLHEHAQFPTEDGMDGGYSALLTKKRS